MDQIFKILEQGNYKVAIIMILVFGLFNIRKIYDFYDFIRMNKLKKNLDHMSNEHIELSMKTLLQDQIHNELFRLTTGINVENFFRQQLMQLHENSKGFITYRQLKHALPYLKLYKNELAVSSNIDLFFYAVINIFFFFVFLAIGSEVIKVPFLMKPFSYYNLLGGFFVGFIIYLIASYYLLKAYAVLDAKKISLYLNSPNRVKE
ncbi:hypothetical protein [Sulfuricurvum sp.]|uniref:hypothetical protein n=1 Tax=Sulfuricurvum sp. TaxID=2025608 RepID=UPI003C54590B